MGPFHSYPRALLNSNMRLDKHKKARRVVHILHKTLDFRTPFKMLCDCNFLIHSWKILKISPLEKLESSLGEKCRLFVTKCIINEMNSLGPNFHDTHKLLNGIEVYKCCHD